MRAKQIIAKIILAASLFNLAACSFDYVANKPHQHSINNEVQTLDKFQTHKILQVWKQNQFQNLPNIANHTVSFTNNHKLASKFVSIKSGYDVASVTTRSSGIGLPVLVQTASSTFSNVTEHAYLTNIYPASLVATEVTTNSGSQIQLTLLDPRENRTYNGEKISVQDNIVIDDITGLPGNGAMRIRGLIQPDKYKNLQGFYLSRPYDKNRIPLIMIHGILSTPEALMDMAEAIDAQPDLYNQYQIWHYFYPTGIPWLATAHDFRDSFRKLTKKLDPQQNHANIKKTVIVAHSMGGLITRVSVTEPKDAIARTYLGKYQAERFFTKPQRDILDQYFHYQPLTEPEKIIFLSVPHGGSRLANGLFSWAANKLISIPAGILKGAAKTLQITPDPDNQNIADTLRLITEENSVNQLQPKNPAIKAISHLPLPKHIEFHSIIGDIGPFNLRFFTDGVVSYPSSHLENVSSETVVYSAHDICDTKAAIDRVIKILRQK